ncbi:MAG TPA: S41 family peptidase [Gemmatimonas sp.]|uniref:S41 family peptidase n=1 Tax=Gemmatimonas sp. TaxID=1962908 RepID=UPI002EDB7D72
MPEILPDTPRTPARRVRAIAAAIFFVALLSVGGWWAGRELTAGEQPTRAPLGGARLFDQVVSTIAQRYVDSLDASEVYDKAVAGMLRELGDPYTTYLAEDRLRRLNEQISGTYAGIGLQIDIRESWPVVLEPINGGPSERAGILTGDRIVQIGKESTRGWTRDEVSRVVRGAQGTAVNFIIERGDQRIPFSIVRDKVHLRAVQRVALLPNGVGYVDVNVFSAQTADELRLAVDSVVRMGARALVMDLRGNPGGLLEQGVAVAELFLDRGQSIVQLRGRPGTASQTYTDSVPQRWPTLPLAVLLDRSSASASEIVAGALQDHDRAIVLGMTSFGKGSAQNVYPLSSGGALRLTIARWYTPLGRGINRAPSVDADGEPELDTGLVTLPDTVKPRYRTDAGRTVFGGGGITPDIVVGDTLLPVPVQALARAMGKNLGAYRDALAREAQAQRRSMQSPGDPVTMEMLNAVYRELERRNVAPPRAIFDAATPWVSRSLGYEMTRVAFGSDAEFLRRTQDDATLQRASSVLQSSRTPRDVFGNIEKPTVTVPLRP